MSGVSNLLCHSKPGVKIATLPLMFQYFGPLLFAGGKDIDGERAATFAPPGDLDYAHFSLPPDVDFSGLPSCWKAIPRRTLAIDKQGLGNWGNSFRDDVKNKVRKARRERVVISKAEKLPVELWQAAYMRKSLRTPISPDSLIKWCDALIKESLLVIYIAQIDSRPVAFRGELFFGEFAYDWIAGFDPSVHSTGANQLLMAEIGDEISKMNLAAWDLVGGEVEKIAEFKKSFGAIEVIHYHLLGALSLKGRIYSAARKVRYGFTR